MDGFVLNGAGVFVPPTPKLIVAGPWHPTKSGIELIREWLDKLDMKYLDKYFKSDLRDRILMMAGSDGNFLSKKFGDLIDGATAYTAPATRYFGLWTAALDDTFVGNTTGEAAYTSYARLALTNNTTIFATGTGTTTYAKSYPSDATKSWPASTGGTAPTVTYLGDLDGNAATSADKGLKWCTVTSTTINTGDTPQLAQNAVTQTRD